MLTVCTLYLCQLTMEVNNQEMRFDSESFGQREPPISVIIKGILDRYPDGQIFKVIAVLYVASTHAIDPSHSTHHTTVHEIFKRKIILEVNVFMFSGFYFHKLT